MRVTDLEKFSLEQIWRPYATLLGITGSLKFAPLTIEGTAELLRSDHAPEWRKCVLGRLAQMRVEFPSHIQHPLVDAVRDGIAKMTQPKDSSHD